jgi:hypothetical protein
MPEQYHQIRAAMKPVAEAFEQLGIRYAVVGSVAGLTHGFSRLTMDVDVVAFFPESQAVEFAQLLEDRYYVDEIMIRDAIRHHHSFNILHNETGLKIDIFIPEAAGWNLEVTERREPETMDDTPPAFWVQSAEDLVLSKLRWFRATNETSDRQWNDVLGVLKMQCFDIDIDYMQKWAPEIGVADLLERALDESGLAEAQ